MTNDSETLGAESAQRREGVSAKWGAALDAGFQIVPNVLLRAQSKMELDTVDLAILLNIMMHWWQEDDLPHPRPSVIAKRIGVSTRTVERRLNALEERNLIHRLGAEKSAEGLSVRRFDLSGLVAELEDLSAGHLELRRESALRGKRGF